jgi:hypothetical protein
LISYTILCTISYMIYTISYKYNVDIVSDIVYDIDIHVKYFSDFSTQVEKLVQILKHKLRQDNAYFKAQSFNPIISAPKEELHQLLIGLYGELLLPATMYEIEKALRNPNTIKGSDKNGSPIYIISKQRLKTVFSRLRNRLSSLDSSTSTIEVTTEYASHFYDMYIRQHDGKHMTGDRMKILMLNLPFLMRDILRPEVRYIEIILYIGYNIVPNIVSCICRHRVQYWLRSRVRLH